MDYYDDEDDDDEVSPYLEEHRFQNQRLVDGVPLNPKLRDDFDDTPNEDRDDLEIEDWWEKPFIVEHTWEKRSQSWEEYLEFSKNFPDMPTLTREAFDQQEEESKQDWFKSYPTGSCFDVRCLDGGAWDRSTLWGVADSFEKACQIIENRGK